MERLGKDKKGFDVGGKTRMGKMNGKGVLFRDYRFGRRQLGF